MRKENIVANAAEKGAYIVQQLTEKLQDQQVTVRGFGLMIGIELPKACGDLVDIARDEYHLILNVTAGSVIRLLPTLNITQEQADLLIDRIVRMVKAYLA